MTDPVYPVYVDSNVMAGRAGVLRDWTFEKILYLPYTDASNFVPELPERRPDLIHLCFPNNPTGAVLTRDQLAQWVAYARANNCVILFDAAYDAFIREPSLPHSIYEIPGAKEVAVEFCSCSKTAGFTGLRCGFVVVPKGLKGAPDKGGQASLNAMWLRRQATKFSGCPEWR